MSEPVYLRIRQALERRIRTGELAPGERLPTEAELCQAHGISRGTAQRVLNELAQAGLAVRRRSLGSFVAGAARQENLLRDVNPRIEGPITPGRHEVYDARVVPLSEAVPHMPEHDEATPVVHLARRKFDEDERPMAMEWSALPFTMVPHLLDEELAHLQVIPYLRELGLRVTKSRMYLDPVLLNAEQAKLLGCEPGLPAMSQRRYTWLSDGTLAESCEYLIRPGLMEFYIEQTIEDP